MPFNIALTGLRAANVDLEVTGNNIANAGTTGFKESRVEFGDLYANAFLGIGQNRSGDGVRVQDIRQQFNQGNITFTDNALDLAVDGNGFFIMNSVNDQTLYTRSGSFFVDKDGAIVNSQGSQLRGFPANEEGVVSGVLDDLSVSNQSLEPLGTTNVELALNLDASEEILLERLESLVTTDPAIVGSPVYTSGLDPANGYPAQQLTFTYPDGNTEVVNIASDYDADTNGDGAVDARIGNASMQDIAAQISNLNDISASAVTTVKVTGFDTPTPNGMTVSVGGVLFDEVTSLVDLGNAINASSSLISVNATIDEAGDLYVTHSRGADLTIRIEDLDGSNLFLNDRDVTDLAGVTTGTPPANPLAGPPYEWTIGGSLTLTFDDDIQVNDTTTDPATGDLVPSIGPFTAPLTGTVVVNNEFDPTDENTYNHATSTTIFDSLGNSHILTMYFVKEAAASANTASNNWTMYTLVDGEDVGDPLTPGDTPTRQGFRLTFDQDGTLDPTSSDQVIITNWQPEDSEGNANGAETPLNRQGLDVDQLITDPPSSSNFALDIGNITQYGSSFSVLDLQQNGYTTGVVNGLDVAQDGVLFARYSNGESQILGQVALADFNSVDSLAPVGETAWVETFASGGAIVNPPGSASLGTIAASSLEESNVDLSEQLVNLIVAQRNYQANAKTIETANATTQTIINLR